MTDPLPVNIFDRNDPFWYKDAVIYQLHVKSFYDANQDGVGDFAGLIEKLEYISSLGVNTIWLLPFYPSPRRDDGYDIAEYRGVHPDYGTLADVRKFIRAAHARGLRVITELVINHTSDQHPWFQRARHAKPGSAARNYYVWSDSDKAYADTRIIFLDTEKSNWTWDPVANAYFWHRFYAHQPDLNYDNPHVLKAVLSIMHYWLDMGVDGLRLDAVPYLVEREGTSNENLPETHTILKKIRAQLDAHYAQRMLLAEANQWPEDAQEYFGNGDECHMCFHFPLMPRMYMAIAREDRFPITDIMQQTPDIPHNCQWAIFLRNHDELTLEMVTSKERDYLWDVYAIDRRARINLGIRRRLAPLMERDRRRIELMNSLLFSMPGTPVIYYGDELGMGDNVHLGDRDGVRTPMQWSPDRNGGFSRADPERLLLPPLMGPLYGYEAVNVEAQQRDQHSLLNWTRRMLATRSQTRAFGRGSLRFLFPGNRKIIAYLREYEDTLILCVANLSRAPQPVELDLSSWNGRVPIELLGGTPFPAIGELPYFLTLPPYGFYWFRLSTTASPPAWHTTLPEQMPEHYTIVLRGKNGYKLTEASCRTLQQHVLPLYLKRQRWYLKDETIQPHALKSPDVKFAHPTYIVELPTSDSSSTPENVCFMAEVQVKIHNQTTLFFLPVALVWSDSLPAMAQQYALARVRRSAEIGMLTDAYTLPAFTHALWRGFQEQLALPISPAQSSATLRFLAEPSLKLVDLPEHAEVTWLPGERVHSTVILGNSVMLTLLRRVVAGIHPAAEMTRHLTQVGYPNSAALLGELVRIDENGTPSTLAFMHTLIPNQGNAWTWTLEYLKRIVETATLTEENAQEYDEALQGYTTFAQTLGTRLAELHATLAQPCDNPAFTPYSVTEKCAKQRAINSRAYLDRALKALENQAVHLPPSSRKQLGHLRKQRQALYKVIDKLARDEVGSLRMRIHGNFHLAHVLVAQNDAYIINFAGKPSHTDAERRSKTSACQDIAGLLYAFYEAATLVATGMGDADSATVDIPSAELTSTMHERRRSLIERFNVVANEAFLAAYFQVVHHAEPRWMSATQEAALIDLALLDKMAEEISTKPLSPTWVSTALAGLVTLTDRLWVHYGNENLGLQAGS